ncbi:MAG: PAS domain-containing protein [Pseudohongiella sp.]|uniref:PAS domain-containing protein n=1 Tax=Pseudohongiella sp. TaxID=1979412 RepID=UPI00349FD73A
MSRYTKASDKRAMILRHTAETALRKGSAPLAGGIPLDREALSLLFEMASDPARSSDALRLLQELQVHQVELDLQREELENSEHNLSRELALYKTVFDKMPNACLVTTLDGRIMEANPAAASLLRIPHDELMGQALQALLKAENQTSWRDMLQQIKTGEQSVSCELEAGTRENETVKLTLSGHSMAPVDSLLFWVS